MMDNIVLTPEQVDMLKDGVTLLYIGNEGMPKAYVRMQLEDGSQPRWWANHETEE